MSGRVWKYGDDVNTDVIFPGKYTYTVNDPGEMAAHALEDLDPGFAKEVAEGDIIVAGRNFGCGSSREQASFCLKYAGVSAIVAVSFSRIYFRNAINAGLPAVTCPEAVESIKSGDTLDIDFRKGKLVISGEKEFAFPPLPESVLGILESGGLIPYTRKVLGTDK